MAISRAGAGDQSRLLTLIREFYAIDQHEYQESRVLDALGPGASAMFLETEAHNERARRFYHRRGFETEDSIWMSRQLNA